MSGRQKVAVVTGGGGGIGAAVAEELGRKGCFVVTVDPLVTLEGNERLPEPEVTTAERIVAAGGKAMASPVSVTDGEAVRALFEELVRERGGLDAVVNVAGITRQTYFASGTEEDWLAVLTVHLQGYLNVLGAALPLMERAGRGRILGVTSGAGWRAADAGAYSCAKRAVASLTWQLGRCAPVGVTVNAMSPIAATRMVAAALERARQAGVAGARGGLALDVMPGPEYLGPIGAWFVDDAFGWCNGRVLFAGGTEVAVVDEPRLLEVVRTDAVGSVDHVLDAFLPGAIRVAEERQASGGGGNPRFGNLFGETASTERRSATVRSCAVVSDRPDLEAALRAALGARAVACHHLDPMRGFPSAGEALRVVTETNGPVDAVIVALAGRPPGDPSGWQGVVAGHRGIVDDLHADAAWARAAADYAAAASRQLSVVTLTDATTPAGRTRAQAAAQLARAAESGTKARVAGFAVGVEAPERSAASAVGALVAHLFGGPDAGGLAGAELVVGSGWVGLRGHPRVAGSVTYGGPAVPPWLDATLREIAGAGASTTDTGS